MLLRIALAAIMGLTGAPAAAQGVDWTVQKNRLSIVRAMGNWADFCADTFGFTRRPAQPPEALETRLDAYLLLSENPGGTLALWADWLGYMDPDSPHAKPMRERAADALLAARADPSQFEAARKLYSDSFNVYFRSIAVKCEAGTRNPFLNQHYYFGTGSTAEGEARMRDGFAAAVRRVDE